MAEGGVAAGEISGIQAVSAMLRRFMPGSGGPRILAASSMTLSSFATARMCQ